MRYADLANVTDLTYYSILAKRPYRSEKQKDIQKVDGESNVEYGYA